MKKPIYSLAILLVAIVFMGAGCLGGGSIWSRWFGAETTTLSDPAMFDLFGDQFDVQPREVKKKHIPNKSSCVDKLDPVKITGPEGSTFHIDDTTVPGWLNISEMTGVMPAELGLGFNCNISEFVDQKAQITINNMGPDGFQVDSFFDVWVEIEVQK